MDTFKGFQDNFEYTAIPKPFISKILPKIDDLDELKVIILFFKIISEKKGENRYATLTELAYESSNWISEMELASALNKATEHETLLKVQSEQHDHLYLLNTMANQQYLNDKKLSQQTEPKKDLPLTKQPPDIFSIYENNIGLITPIIAEELKLALSTYPEEWIKEAITEAAKYNKRNWRYINKILDNWVAQGKDDGTYQRHNEKKHDRYVKGRYGRFVQR